MSELTTDDVIRRFNESFVQHDPEALSGLVAQDCVMESVGPAPDGTRYEGRDACLRFWQELANDPNTSFEPVTGALESNLSRTSEILGDVSCSTYWTADGV